MANLVFIPAPDLPPPPGQVGIIRWLKLNFFKDTFSSVLTLLGLYFIFWITGPLLSWFILDAVYAGDSAACNAAEGACWSFIRAQIKLFLFGLFPRDLLWRPILAAALLAITFALTATRIIPVLAMVLCWTALVLICLLYTSPSPRDRQKSRMPSSA